ncbi:DNA-binding protein WhiA [Mycoplasmopsis lipofaciens]|uniref:DNA-binding protein WhiA n=1 Tax=Mycoplasmopsis lipofaciens TaxID=114884 RepID=UPI0004838BD4|nr:DNA-binding protein WhiA [Mycoplasmopsis lipofaciens]
MNFSQQIKREIIERKKNKNETMEFLRGFIFAKGYLLKNNIKLIIKDNLIFDTIIKYLAFNEIEYIQNRTCILYIQKNDINLKEQFSNPSMFFAGFFVGSGSISSLNKSSYHLEISSNYEHFIDIFINKLNEYHFGFNKLKHKNKYVAYIKKHEKIADFLKAIIAIDSLFIFEDKSIQRDFDNSLNRINNIDIANIKKVTNAYNKHIKNIEYIYQNNLLNAFNESQITFFKIMQTSEPETLDQYVEILKQNNINITKSGLNHWLMKLNKIVLKDKENKK